MVILSKETEELLVGAAKSKTGDFTKQKGMGGYLGIVAGKKRLTTSTPKETAIYEEAIKTLLKHGFIKLSGSTGTIYQVTEEGYNQVDAILKEKGEQFKHLTE